MAAKLGWRFGDLEMLSVIIPVLNEEKNIASAIKKIDADEIVVVDDGSSDRTERIVKELAEKNRRIKLVRHSVNLGKGAAMRSGAKSAKGDVIVFIDADDQFNAVEIPKLVKALEKGDMAIGVRNFSSIPAQRKVTNVLSKIALFLATGKNIRDPLSGFRAMRRDDFLKLNPQENRYAIEAELNYKAIKNKMRIVGLPVAVRYNGTSSITFKEGVYITAFLIKIVLRMA